MKKNRLLIVSADDPAAISLSETLSRYDDFEICAIAHDGLHALQLLSTIRPDIVLTDLLLPRLDGLCMIRQICAMPNPPIVICQSDFHSRDSIEAVRRSGASHFILKPVSTDVLVVILREYLSIRQSKHAQSGAQKDSTDYNQHRLRVHQILHDFGFSPRYCGSSYIAESVLLALRTPSILQNMSGGLYRQLSENMHTTPSRIERSIRTAITATNVDGHLTRQIGSPPTNKTCLQFLLKILNTYH